MDRQRIRDALIRVGFAVNEALLEALDELIEHGLDELTEGGSGFYVWAPEDWVGLDEALDGWDLRGELGNETGDPYVGPAGIAVAGNASDDMLCFLAENGGLEPTLLRWDQTIGQFATIVPIP